MGTGEPSTAASASQAGGHSGEAVQRLKGSHAGGYRCGEKRGWSTGSRLHPLPPISPGGHPAPRKGDAGLGASKRSRYPQRGRRCEGEHSRLRALNPRAPPIQKGTVGPPPIRSEGRGMRPEVLLWCCSLHTETGRVGSKCSHPAPVPGGTHGKPADWFPGGREVGQWPPG